MTNKGIFFIAAASSVALLFALNMLQVEIGEERPATETMAMAPISLGNPAAAATLQTRRPVPPQAEIPMPPQPAIYNQRIEIGNGDTLAELLVRAGVGRTDAHYAIKAMSHL